MKVLTLSVLLLAGSASLAQNLPDVSAGAQANSLMGESLFSAAPGQGALDRLAEARQNYDDDPHNADNIIWYGRRTAYTGDYRGAIEIFSIGIAAFPDDARLYRHRGHRYISIREFDLAIADLEHAAQLIEGTENEIEPDGMPNELNIPISSLHGNTWYHLGLAYYLNHDWPNAYRAYTAGFEAGRNDDNRVSTTHWRYMILRRMGEQEKADQVLEVITKDMDILENMVYHNLCLFYKGELSLEEMLGDEVDSPTGAAAAYGVANWYYYNGDEREARSRMEALLATDGWSAFGFVAAEADLAAM